MRARWSETPGAVDLHLVPLSGLPFSGEDPPRSSDKSDWEHHAIDFIQSIRGLDGRFIDQFVTALAPLIATVAIHGQGMRLATRLFQRFRGDRQADKLAEASTLVVIGVVAVMLATHFLEIAAWAVFFILADIIPSLDAAMYFSISSYSTLGVSGIVLEDRWRGIAGFETMTSMLMFGWSTAVLVSVVNDQHH